MKTMSLEEAINCYNGLARINTNNFSIHQALDNLANFIHEQTKELTKPKTETAKPNDEIPF